MNILEYLAKRVDKSEVINKQTYAEGIFDIISFLFVDLWDMMKAEKRFFGIIPVYERTIKKSLNNISKNSTEEDIETFGKILYLFKPIFLKDYKRLCSKHLSKADSIIVIIHKVLELLKDCNQFTYKEDLDSIFDIVEKLFNNIRNNAKKSDLMLLMSSLNYYMDMGWAGKTALHDFRINLEDDNQRKEKSVLEGSGIRFDESDNENIGEIIWKEE